MKRCVIFCAGGFSGLVVAVEEGDVVIAADGGLRYAQALEIQPDHVLGDFDSLGYCPAGATVFPVEKDDTDCMLAIKLGLAQGCDTFYIYGSLDGTRLEHTVANFQALHYLCDHGARGYLIGENQIVCGLRDGRMTFPATWSGYFSVFCLGADASGVCLQGLKYTAKDIMLTANFPLGVSNQFIGQPGAVSVGSGTLLLIWDKANGLA